MEVVCTRKKIILFFIYSHDKFLALSLLNPLENKSGVATECRPLQTFQNITSYLVLKKFGLNNEYSSVCLCFGNNIDTFLVFVFCFHYFL